MGEQARRLVVRQGEQGLDCGVWFSVKSCMIELWGLLFIVNASHEDQRYELWKPQDRLPTPAFSGFLDRLPLGSDNKESSCNAGDLGLIPGLERSPGEGNGNPLRYSCLENRVDGGSWQATVLGVAKSQTRLSDFHTHTYSGCGSSSASLLADTLGLFVIASLL